MPQWGMGKGLQNVVNSWVNVNHHHSNNSNSANLAAKTNEGTQVVHHHQHHLQQQQQQSPSDSSASNQNNMVNQQRRQQGGMVELPSEEKKNVGNVKMFSDIDATYSSSSGMTTAAPSLGKGAASLSPYLMYGSKTRTPSLTAKSSGKLKRTNSQSDLLKERAARRNNTHNHVRRTSANEELLLFGLSSMLNITNNTNNEKVSHAIIDRGVEQLQQQQQQQQQQKIINTGQYINENAFANQHRSMQFAAQQLENMAKLKKGTQLRSQTNSAPPPSISSDIGTSSQMEIIGRRQSLPESIKFPPSTGPLHAASVSASLDASLTKEDGAVESSPNCNKCHELDKRILALESDLEYMRSVALNNEYVCVSCERRNTNNPTNSASSVASARSVRSNISKHSRASSRMLDTSLHSHGARSITRKSRQVDNIQQMHDNLTLAQASRRLVDLTARHKRQIEHMSKEMGRWQHDMHLKLSKLAMMCKDLNDESAKRKEQADVARQDLDTIREERNALSSELEILRARIAFYEKQEAENTEIRRLLRENQNETISMADQAIAERDGIIEELTSQLQHFIEMLPNEKNKS